MYVGLPPVRARRNRANLSFSPAVGNYVVQGALRFGTPTNDFIFDAMVDRCWEIGSGRFGARSTRQTLENPLSSALNIKRVAIAIILNSIPLATSSNGALLVTWLLESSNLPGRYRLLAPRFSPHLAHLCTHKLASGAVLKIINQRVDPAAARMLLDAIFAPESKTLEDILGASTIPSRSWLVAYRSFNCHRRSNSRHCVHQQDPQLVLY